MVSKTHKHRSTTLNKLLAIGQMFKKQERIKDEERRRQKAKLPTPNSQFPIPNYQLPVTNSQLSI